MAELLTFLALGRVTIPAVEKNAPEIASYKATKTVKDITELVAHSHSALRLYLGSGHVLPISNALCSKE